MTTYSIYIIILGFFSLNWILIFIGAIVLLAQYFYETIDEERERRAREYQLKEYLRERNEKLNEILRRTGRLN